MAESVAERAPERRPEDPFDELRSLLVGPEQRELLELHSHLHDSSLQTQAVASVLPDAFALKVHDAKLSGAVAPMVEEAITASVRRNPQPLADALFPVIGPAIRKAIQHALATMMESFNRSVEHSLSWRALQVAMARLAHRQALRRDRAAQHTRISRRTGLPDPRRFRPAAAARRARSGRQQRRGPDLRDAHRDPRFRARFVQGRRPRYPRCAPARRPRGAHRAGTACCAGGGRARHGAAVASRRCFKMHSNRFIASSDLECKRSTAMRRSSMRRVPS